MKLWTKISRGLFYCRTVCESVVYVDQHNIGQLSFTETFYYRAMHYSAKRGLAITSSVHL